MKTFGQVLTEARKKAGLTQREVAARLRREYLTQRRSRYNRNVRGTLAAYVADEYLLGHGSVGWRLVDSAYRGGYLISYSFGEVTKFERSPAAYLRELRGFLRRLHYS